MKLTYKGKDTGITFRFMEGKIKDILVQVDPMMEFGAFAVVTFGKRKLKVTSEIKELYTQEVINNTFFLEKHGGEILINKELFNLLTEDERLAILLHENRHAEFKDMNEENADNAAIEIVGEKVLADALIKTYNFFIKKIKETYDIEYTLMEIIKADIDANYKHRKFLYKYL